MSQNRKVANRFGKVFKYPRRVTELNQLKPGDHIVYEHQFSCTYWHHMIVESITPETNKINVIHYYGEVGNAVCHPKSTWVKVRRDSFHINEEKFYRLVYPKNVKRCTPSEVVNNARTRLGEKKYNPISNNCEHFATECTIGKPESLQIWTLLEIIGKECLVGWFTPHYLTGLRNLIVKLFDKLCSKIGLSAVDDFVESLNRCINAAKNRSASFKLGLLISFVIELVFVCNDIWAAYEKMKAGEMSKSEYDEVVVKRVTSGVCSLPMSIACILLGQAICPIPVLGGIIGGIVGDFCGKVVGGLIGGLLVPIFSPSPEKDKGQ